MIYTIISMFFLMPCNLFFLVFCIFLIYYNFYLKQRQALICVHPTKITITKHDTFHTSSKRLRVINHVRTRLISCASVWISASVVIATSVILRHTSLSVASLRAISICRALLTQRRTLFHTAIIIIIRS